MRCGACLGRKAGKSDPSPDTKEGLVNISVSIIAWRDKFIVAIGYRAAL
jgi:hypothetical protein